MNIISDQVDDGVSPLRGRVAVVHDWLPVYAGAERVLEQIIRVVPQADLFALFDFIPDNQRDFLAGKPVKTSFIQHAPFARRHYRFYLPLCPLAIEGLDVTDYDVVISSSYVVAKGVLTAPHQLHVSYVHSPLRYAWDLQFQYLADGPYSRGAGHVLARAILHYMRLYDVMSANRPDLLLANSRYVARRIWKTYRRRATVVHPPVDVDSFPLYERKEDFYVTVSRLVPYKRVDLLVQAFNGMPQRELFVIGDGPEYERLNAMAEPNVILLGHQPLEAVVYYMQRARGFVFGALEDFGIAPIEAQACGTPTIAFARGGTAETVVPGVSGVLFEEQTVGSIVRAISRFEQVRERLEPEIVRGNAERFSAAIFRERLTVLLHQAVRRARSGAQPEDFDEPPAATTSQENGLTRTAGGGHDSL